MQGSHKQGKISELWRDCTRVAGYGVPFNRKQELCEEVFSWEHVLRPLNTFASFAFLPSALLYHSSPVAAAQSLSLIIHPKTMGSMLLGRGSSDP